MHVHFDLTRVVSPLVRSGHAPSTLDQAPPSAVLMSPCANRGQCLPVRDPRCSNASVPPRPCLG
jgi:hypothetical protein